MGAEFAKGGVGLGTGVLQIGEGGDDLLRLALASDPKILLAPLCLGAPVMVRRDLHLTHGVILDAIFHMVPPHIRATPSLRAASATALATASFTRGSKALGRM